MKKNSIGNDIVDLLHINVERSKQKIFYSKFITEAEAKLYNECNSTLSFEQFIWLCWSVKEATYKFQKRLQPELNFSPGKIIFQEINFSPGIKNLNFTNDVLESKGFLEKKFFNSISHINSKKFYSKSFIENEFIYTVTGIEENFKDIFWGIQKIESSAYHFQSESVRKFCSKKLIQVLNKDNISILKAEDGYPYVNEHKNIPLSFTHHTNFIAYSFIEVSIYSQ